MHKGETVPHHAIALTNHTTACCSAQVVGITLTTTPFYEYYTQHNSTIEYCRLKSFLFIAQIYLQKILGTSVT
jgi:hypothetical protein